MRLFGSERIAAVVDKLGMEDNEALESSMLSNSIERAPEEGGGEQFRYPKETSRV